MASQRQHATQGVQHATLPIAQLVPHPRNYRRHPDTQIARLCVSLARFGQVRSIVVQAGAPGKYLIVAGHGLVEAAKRSDITELRADVIPAEWTDEQVTGYLIADNQLGAGADDDLVVLAQLLEEQRAAGADLESMGYSGDELDALLVRLADDALKGNQRDVDDPSGGGDDFDATPDESGPTRCQPGDLWQLGRHRLLCGDSTKREDVARLMDGAKADMVLTDPPYGVGYQTKLSVDDALLLHRRTDGLEVANDAMTREQTAAFLRTAFEALRISILRPGGVFYVCSPSGDMETVFRNALDDSGLGLRECIVWVKDVFVFGRQDYHWRHESILYGWADGAAHFFVNDRTQDTVWEMTRPRQSKDHPTMKPLPLMAKAIQNSSCEGETVFDGFGGSGSTLIACERTERICRTIELDPRYCDVILRRWETETGQEATLLDRSEEVA